MDAQMDAEVDAGCSSNAQCDDGVFCNGEEVCTLGVCESPGDPCTSMTYDAGTGAADGGASLVCDEDMNACVGCTENADCEVQVPTLPICEDSMCIECTANADCTGNPSGELCNASTHRCVECLVNGDCEALTPICSIDQTCRPCASDVECSGMTGTEQCALAGPMSGACVECDNTSACAGTEACVSNICAACTVDADCDDGNAATTDYCNEGPDPNECVHVNGLLIFVTAAPWTTPDAGIAAADAFCNADAARPGTGGLTFKAMLVDGTTRTACTTADCSGGTAEHDDWVLAPSTTYLRADGATIGTTTSNGIFDLVAGLMTGFSTAAGTTWTGLDTDWTNYNFDCTAWTVGTSADNGAKGAANSTTASAIGDGSTPCDNDTALLTCVQQ